MAGNSLAKKLALAVFIATAVLLGIMALFSAHYAQSAMEAKGKEELREQLRSTLGMITSYEASVKAATNRLFNFFAASFDQPITLDTRDSITSGDKSLPALKLAGNTLNNQTGLVDRFNTIAGMPATIFVLHEGTFYRIATSVKKENGERAVGTSLPKEHPATSKLLAGQEFVGKAIVVGKTMMTKYKALKDGSGKVVGAIFVGLDFEAGMQDLKKQMLTTKVGKTGYLYVIDTSNTNDKGKLIVHPSKTGENILNAKDHNGNEFFKTMIEQKTGEVIYPWKGDNDTAARDKIAVFETFPEWNWLVAGGTYLDEFSEDSRTLRNVLIAGSVLTILILGAIVVVLANRMVKEPLQAMVNLFGQISQGNLNNTITITSDDEIGELQRAVQHMQTSLSTLVREIKEVVNGAQQGDFSHQVSLAGKQGFGLEVGESLNALVTTADTGLTDIMHIAQALAAGDLSQTISKTYPGTFGKTVVSINTTVHVLNQVISEVREIVNNASEGNFSQRLETGHKQGYAKTLANLLNRLSENAANALSDISRVAQALGKGDLTQSIEKDYPGLFGETARGINATTNNLQDLIGSVVLAVGTIDVAAQEISAGNKDLSARTQEQATSLEETAASLEQFSSMMQHNTDSAKEASQLADIASDVAVKGGAVVKASVTTMTQISESSKRIGDIIGVIDGIAFQTNILALNAAVEAARAGEQGRGFAVVASEVRSLAQRSAQAAKEIKDLITDSVEKVERGTEQAEEAGQTMDNIVTAIGKVTEIITNISRASLEQSSGIAQINQALVQMDGVTQQNASLVEESAAAAESLESQARDLQAQIASFRLHR